MCNKYLLKKHKARKLQLIDVSLTIDEFCKDFSLELLALVARMVGPTQNYKH